MRRSLLDTDILSEYLKGYDHTVARWAAEYAQQFGHFTFTSVTVYEIVYGLELKGASAQLEKALTWLSRNEQVAPVADDYLLRNSRKTGAPRRSGSAGFLSCMAAREGAPFALEAARIKAAARKQGSTLELPDCLIAAVAVRLSLVLVTGNVEDFRAIQRAGAKLVIENWREL